MSAVYIAIGITLLGLLLSALYSGLETGLYTINQIRLNVRATSKLKSAMRIRQFMEHPTRMLAVLLVCNNIANFLASYGAARILEETTLGPWLAIAVNAIVMIPLLFMFGEVLPKDLFRTHTDTWTYSWSGFLIGTDRVLWWTGVVPLVAGIGNIARAILGTECSIEATPRRRFGLLLKEGLEDGVLTDEQITLADRVLSMQNLFVRSEMVPWTRVSCLGENISLLRRSNSISDTPHTRLPVVNADGRVTGILPVLSVLLNPDASTATLATEPLYITPEMKVLEALHLLRTGGKSMAIVSDNSSRPIGIVTLKDLVEPVVGELAAW